MKIQVVEKDETYLKVVELHDRLQEIKEDQCLEVVFEGRTEKLKVTSLLAATYPNQSFYCEKHTRKAFTYKIWSTR